MVLVPEDELFALEALIRRLETADPLSPVDEFYKRRDRKIRFIAETSEQLHRKLERTRTTAVFQPRNKKHPIYGDTHHALGYQVRQLDDHMTDWLAWAHFVPPGPASR